MPAFHGSSSSSSPAGLACSVAFLAAFLTIFVGIPALLNMLRRHGVWAHLEARGFVIVRRPTEPDNQLLARMVDAVPEPWPQITWRKPRNVRTRVVWFAVSDRELIAEHRFDAFKQFPRYATSITTFDGIAQGTLKLLFQRHRAGPDLGVQSMSEVVDQARQLGMGGTTVVCLEKATSESIERLLRS